MKERAKFLVLESSVFLPWLKRAREMYINYPDRMLRPLTPQRQLPWFLEEILPSSGPQNTVL